MNPRKEPGKDVEGDGQLPFWEAHYASEDLSRFAAALAAGFDRPRLLRAFYPVIRMLDGLGAPLGSSIELGCGSGAFSLVLARLGLVREVTLLDYSAAALEAAGRLFSRFSANCTLVHSPIESAPFESGSFDLALSAGVIEHYPSAAGRASCLEAHLELGRLAYVQAPLFSPLYWASRGICTLVKGGWPFGYERPVGRRELERLCREAGAEVLGSDHVYFASFHLFTRLHRLPRPGWYTRPIATEAAVLARRAADRGGMA